MVAGKSHEFFHENFHILSWRISLAKLVTFRGPVNWGMPWSRNWILHLLSLRKMPRGDLQDGRRVRYGDHLPPHTYIRNTSTCGTTPTEHLLNAGRPQTSQKIYMVFFFLFLFLWVCMCMLLCVIFSVYLCFYHLM